MKSAIKQKIKNVLRVCIVGMPIVGLIAAIVVYWDGVGMTLLALLCLIGLSLVCAVVEVFWHWIWEDEEGESE
jgi:ABC-type sugar transport system permease subunit